MTVSGCLKMKEEIDRYCFRIEQTGPVTCRLPAHRYGHPIHAIVEVSDSNGRRVAEFADTEGTGLTFTFAAQAGEMYTSRLYDLDFRGDRSMVYRLTLEPAPCVVTAIPAVGQRGTTRRVTLLGYGLATGTARLESIEREIAFPSGSPQDSFSYRVQTPVRNSSSV